MITPQAVVASCHIPYYVDGRPTARFRNSPAIDGGFAELIPRIPGALLVCPFPRWITRALCYDVHIGPDHVRHMLPRTPTLLAETLRPPTLENSNALFQAGELAMEEYINRGEPAWKSVALVDTKSLTTQGT